MYHEQSTATEEEHQPEETFIVMESCYLSFSQGRDQPMRSSNGD